MGQWAGHIRVMCGHQLVFMCALIFILVVKYRERERSREKEREQRGTYDKDKGKQAPLFNGQDSSSASCSPFLFIRVILNDAPVHFERQLDIFLPAFIHMCICVCICENVKYCVQ